MLEHSMREGIILANVLTPFQYYDRPSGHLLIGALESARNGSSWLVSFDKDLLLLLNKPLKDSIRF